MAKLPEISLPGYREMARAIDNLQQEIYRVDGQVAIALGGPPRPLIIRQKTVVVVQRPTAQDHTLQVREVRYGTLPPKPPLAEGQQAAIASAIEAQAAASVSDAGDTAVSPPGRRSPLPVPKPREPPHDLRDELTVERLPGPIDIDPEHELYDWAGLPFDASPDYGQTALAYEFSFWDAEENGVPTVDTVFLRARREHDSWIAELGGGGGIAWSVLRGYPDPQGHVLFVQRLQKPSPFLGEWTVSPTAPLLEVFTFGGLKAIEYVQHVWAADEILDYTPILPLVHDGQHWTALHLFKFLVGSYQPPVNDFRITDCQL